MNIKIVETAKRVVLVGGGVVNTAALRDDMAQGDVVLVAADGGAKAALALGRPPDAVYGDMDSLDAETLETLARLPQTALHRIAEQDSTDFEKCLRHIQAPLVVGHGFLGGRLDHALAALHALAAYPQPRCLLVGDEDVACLCPPVLTLDVLAGTRVSLFPMAPVTGRSEGLRWPIDGIGFAPDRRVGTSNAALGGRVRLEMNGPGMLLILPVEMRAALATAVERAPPWPVRAG